MAGWREWVSIPTLGVDHLKAKLDTGARTSAIHAYDVTPFERDGSEWVRFSVHPWQRSESDAVTAELPVLDRRTVRSSSGHREDRVVVTVDVIVAGRTVPAELTLTNRSQLGFRMLIGREALRPQILVDPGRSYLGGRPDKAVRDRNRGK